MKTTKFKSSEIGPIPEGWEVKRLGDCAIIARGGSPRPIDSYLTTRSDGLNWVKIGDVSVGAKYIERTEEKILPSGLPSTRQVHPGDFLLSNSMSFGRPYIMRIDGCIHDGWLVIQDYKREFDTEFLYYILGSSHVFTQYQVLAAGSSVLNLNKDVVANVLVTVPPLAEQEAIARALSDVDALLAAMTALIAKKRAIKQGAMQELLEVRSEECGVRSTPRRRLAGFSGEWAEKRLGDCATMFAGGTPSSKVAGYYGGAIPWVSISDISTAGKYIETTAENLTEAGLNNSSAKWYPKNTLLFAMYASIGKCCIARERMTSSQAILGIHELDDLDLEFLYYLLTYRNKEFLTMGQTGTQSNLSKAIVEDIVVCVPTLAEQKAIAGVLADMDAEIAALEAKRAKYEQVKQGMMQELLTGRVRLA